MLDKDDWQLLPKFFRRLSLKWGIHHVDRGEELFSSGEGGGNSRPSCSRNWRVLALRIDCRPSARRTPAHHRCLHPQCDLRVLRWEDVSFLPTYLEFRFVKRKNDQHRLCGKVRVAKMHGAVTLPRTVVGPAAHPCDD
eukprot:jgi/Tetstr1/436739/TSEL_025521.t1